MLIVRLCPRIAQSMCISEQKYLFRHKQAAKKNQYKKIQHWSPLSESQMPILSSVKMGALKMREWKMQER